MRIPLTSCLLAVIGLAAWSGRLTAESETATAPALLSTNPVQRVVLDPMQVTRIPVATDHLTTIRFPSPIADLASALVATEVHPSARFLLSFQPGESFFSLRALTPGASTTLNVVWKSQTYVLDLTESHTPWLSVIMTQPEPAKVQIPSTPPAPLQPRPWAQFLETAKAYETLKRKYPTALPDLQVWSLGNQRDFGTYALRTDQLFYFQSDEILVMQVTIANRTPEPLNFGPNPFSITIGKRAMPVLLTDFGGMIPGGAESVAFIVFNSPPLVGGRASLLSEPISVTLSAPSLPARTVTSPAPPAKTLGNSSGKTEPKAVALELPLPVLGRGVAGKFSW